MPAAFWWKVFCRSCQTSLYMASFLMPQWRPKILRGKDAVVGLPEFLRGKKLHRPMVVTDGTIMKIGLVGPLLKKFEADGVSVALYQDVTPNPTLDQVEAAYSLYRQEKCDCIIGFGGGSSIDCAKLVGVRVARPRTPISWMRGLLKVLWPLPPIIAVPTTAGTGSEVTVAAVVRDPKTQEKYALADGMLVPRYAVHDPVLTVGLPKSVTAMTGLDALTHGVEAYLNIFQVAETREAARMCIRLVFNNLRRAYDNPQDVTARGNMMEAAYLGGIAFTRAYVGNVHAIAHALGAYYDVPHGLANAIVLPFILEFYGSAVTYKLARLAEMLGMNGNDDQSKADQFIQAIRALNEAVGIPRRITDLPNTSYHIHEADIPGIVAHAYAEANPIYPVPVILTAEDFTTIVRQLM